MSKFKAFFLHFLISFLIILSFIIFVYYVWYQSVFFNASGVSTPLKMLVVVDVILGPLLTFIVYKEGKKYLKIDLILIVVFQLVAFTYGAYSIYLGKPSLVIHRTGYFEVVIEKNVDYTKLSNEMRANNFSFYPVYGKIDTVELDPISNAQGYMDEVELFDNTKAQNFTKPLTLEQAQYTFKNSELTVQEHLASIIKKNNSLMFYELKFNGVYGVLIINNSNLEFEEILIP